jgi:hypothetical protein
MEAPRRGRRIRVADTRRAEDVLVFREWGA